MSNAIPTNDRVTTFLLDDPGVPTVYANALNVIIADSDVSISFGLEPVAENTLRPSVRVVLSHASFMRMMEHLASRYKFFQTVYNGNLPTLRSIDQKIVQNALSEMLALPLDKRDENG